MEVRPPPENDAMSRPRALANIRVVDFSWVRSGPWPSASSSLAIPWAQSQPLLV